jgi:AcrR family transcriptional regulator
MSILIGHSDVKSLTNGELHITGSLGSSPRQRMIDALASSIAEVGYQHTTIGEIVRRASTSRRTFYEHFADRDACFVALLRLTHLEAIQTMSDGIDRSAPWKIQIRQAVEGWLDCAEPRLPVIMSWIQEAPALGKPARDFKYEVDQAYVRLIQSISDSEPLRAAGFEMVSRPRALAFIGGLRLLAITTIESGGQLRDVAEDAVDSAIRLFNSCRIRQSPREDGGGTSSSDKDDAEGAR